MFETDQEGDILKAESQYNYFYGSVVIYITMVFQCITILSKVEKEYHRLS